MQTQASAVIKQSFNNPQPNGIDEEGVRFRSAMSEVARIQQKNRKGVVIDIGFILQTHGFIFELTKAGWVLRPDNYLCDAEVYKRLPEKWRRAEYYRMRCAQKRWLRSLQSK